MKKAATRGRPPKDLEPDSFVGQVGAIIRATRERKGKTVEECAIAAGVSVPAWYHFENGKIGFEKLPRIAFALGIRTRLLIPESSPE